MHKPKIYTLGEHRIPPYKVDKQAFYVIEKLKHNGYLSYLVGGSVRDLLLNLRPKDFDISTSAKPEEIKRLFKGNCILIGKRFRLAHIRFGRKVIEVSTFRAGETEEARLILRDNIWGNPEQDVLRRDFTINGLFYNPEVQTLIDYVNGFKDLEKKIIRTIGDPKVRFVQDPVRMIRLLKFKARFDFHIEDETFNAMISLKNEITKSSPARVLEELFKMLESASSKRFFYLLTKHEILNILSPTLGNYYQKNPHAYNMLEIIDNFIKKNHPKVLDRSLLISSLIFDILQTTLISEFVKKNKHLDLSIIYFEAKKIIDDVFKKFFHLSRKIKTQMLSILTNQFRIKPLTIQKKRILKIPKDPFFGLALEFFNLRSMQDPKLTSIYTQWNEKFIESHKNKRKI